MNANTVSLTEDTINKVERCVLILINIEERHTVEVLSREGK